MAEAAAGKMKERLKNLGDSAKKKMLNKRSPSMGEKIGQEGRGIAFTPEELSRPAIVRQREPGPDFETTQFPTDPLEDQAILDGMEPEYYEDNFDPSEHELKKLPPCSELEQASIDVDRKRLKGQQLVVTKRVFGQILSAQSACHREMERVEDVGDRLSGCIEVCRAGRGGLGQASREFTESSLGILSAYRRRQQAKRLLNDLNIIRTLHKTDERLQELLADDDYPGAIQVLIECQTVVATYSHFAAVKQLASKLQDTLEMMEERLDVALAKVCVDFTPTLYDRLSVAFSLLGKTQTSMDQLHMHLTSAIHNTAWNVVFGHAALLQQPGFREQQLGKKPYADLCGCIAEDLVLPCLVDLCRALWNIMNSYRQIVAWHDVDSNCGEEEEGGDADRQYIERKLANGKMRIWQDVQTKVRVFVLANDLSGLGIDTFLEFMDVIHKLIEVGHDFCGSPSNTLQESLKKQCWSYFQSYHLERLEEIKMHLENEGWALCPVKPTFKVPQLVEFRRLNRAAPKRFSSPKKKESVKAMMSPFDQTVGANSDEEEEDVFADREGAVYDEETEDGFYTDDDDEEGSADALRRELVSDKSGIPNFRRTTSRNRRRLELPILTNTSLMLLRLCGKYIHLMKDLKPIASDVFHAMTQLLDFYVIVVYTFFTKDLTAESRLKVTDAKLQDIVDRIEREVVKVDAPLHKSSSIVDGIGKSSPMKNFAQSNESLASNPPGIVAMPELSPAVDLARKETLFGLPERFVAAESALYLVAQFVKLKGAISTYLITRVDDSTEERDAFAVYEERTLAPLLSMVVLRRPVYYATALRSVNAGDILQLMSKVAWDIKEVRSQHSHYVDVLLKEIQDFADRIEEVRRSQQPITSEARRAMWELCALCASDLFVEGFSCAKKCSNEGRALMQLDYRQFLLKLESISGGDVSKPVPYQDYVGQYVKAYYIPESELEGWVKEHNQEYTAKQMVSLVNSVAYSNNRTRQKLNSLISDLSVRIRR